MDKQDFLHVLGLAPPPKPLAEIVVIGFLALFDKLTELEARLDGKVIPFKKKPQSPEEVS